MAMKMLEAGGVPVLTDGIRTADESNPRGYYEFEAVKELDKSGDLAWLPDARGKAVKIISFLLLHLPDAYDYRVIFMHRDLDEVIASQNKMLVQRGEGSDTTSDDRMREIYAQHLKKVERFLANRRYFSYLPVHYRDVVEQPGAQARRVGEFLGQQLDLGRMAAVADRVLYRNRGNAAREA